MMNVPPSVDEPRMTFDEFRAGGWLQEANRQFFHPHGLALAIFTTDNGDPVPPDTTRWTIEIWDARDDPEGIIFDDLRDLVATSKAVAVDETRPPNRALHLIQQLDTAGEGMFGTIQPIGTTTKGTP